MKKKMFWTINLLLILYGIRMIRII